jgi:hypothetical protein
MNLRSKIMKTKQHKLINGRWVIKNIYDALQASSFDIYINTHRKLETPVLRYKITKEHNYKFKFEKR